MASMATKPLDSVETALNSSGDMLFTATAEFKERLKRGEEIRF